MLLHLLWRNTCSFLCKALTLCLLGNSACFCRLLIFSKNQLFGKILSGIPSEGQTVWIRFRRDILSGLIWFQTVCKSYQQTALVGKQFTPQSNNLLQQITNFTYEPVQSLSCQEKVKAVKVMSAESVTGYFKG